jgi:hypothetical protein
MKESIKKFLVAVAIIAGMTLLLIADAKYGESVCGEGQYNQTTGECVE